LIYKGFKVTFVSNITDVDDKTIRDSQKAGKTLKEFTEYYTQEFLKDLDALGILRADIMPKATEHIDEMVEMIEALKKKGLAYEKNGSWYFRVSAFDHYGDLAHIDPAHLKTNADGRCNDADEYSKEDVRDFVLWKAYQEEDGDVFWETSLGKGRPGWHIECSAMAAKYLGTPFDMHLGGCDLIFPHHTNEIAQSEGALGKKFCNYWLHNAHLLVNGEKMSKSKGNFFTLRDLLSKGYDAKAIRYQLLSTHYRQELNFTEDALQHIPNTLQRVYDFQEKLLSVSGAHNPKVHELIDRLVIDFETFMDDDLNISGALGALFEFIREVNKLIMINNLSSDDADCVLKVLRDLDQVLGVLHYEKGALDDHIQSLVDEREEARKNKDFKRADEIRDILKKQGIILEDTPQGVRWKRAVTK
jgi:cysteinyl-tRNA synthetase